MARPLTDPCEGGPPRGRAANAPGRVPGRSSGPRRLSLVAPRPGRSRRLGIFAACCLGGLVVNACSARPGYRAATTIVKPNGNCDTTRIVPVGVSVDLSGTESALGKEYLRGLEVAVDTVNHAKGILKKHNCLELLYKDDRGDPRIGDRAVLDLVNAEGVSFLVAPHLSSQIQFAGAHLGRSGVPTVSFSSLDETYQPKSYPQAFPIASSTADQAAAMAAFAHARRWSSVGVVAVGDPAGRQGADEAAQGIRGNGQSVTGPIIADPGSAGATAAIRELKNANPDGVILLGDSLAVADLLKARSVAGWTVPLVAEAVAADRSVIDAVGMDKLGGVSVLVPKTLVRTKDSAPDVTAFRDQLHASLGSPTIGGSIWPYAQAADAIAMMASVANGVRSTSPGAVRTFLENANYQGVLASYSFTADIHTGIAADQNVVVALNSLSDGLFNAP